MVIIFHYIHGPGGCTGYVYQDQEVGILKDILEFCLSQPLSAFLSFPSASNIYHFHNNSFAFLLEKYQSVDPCESCLYPMKTCHWLYTLHSILFFRALEEGRGEGKSQTRRFCMPYILVSYD